MSPKNTWGTVETAKSPSGKATIKVGKRQFRVTFDDGSVNKRFDLDDLPENAPKKLKNGTYFVALNAEKDTVYRIGPVKGLFNMRCVDFVREAEGDPPVPQTREYKKKYPNSKNTYQCFTATFEITDGPFEGCTIGKFLHYKFTEGEDGIAMFKGKPGTANYEALVNFCEVTGLTEAPMEWDEEDGNILPEMLHVIRKKDYTVEGYVKDGYIEDLNPLDSGDFDEDEDLDGDENDVVEDDLDEDDEEPVKKGHKPAKKSKRTRKQEEEEDERDDLDDDDDL